MGKTHEEKIIIHQTKNLGGSSFPAFYIKRLLNEGYRKLCCRFSSSVRGHMVVKKIKRYQGRKAVEESRSQPTWQQEVGSMEPKTNTSCLGTYK